MYDRNVFRRWQWLTGLALATMGFTVFDVMGRMLYERFMATSAISVCAILLAVALTHLRQLLLQLHPVLVRDDMKLMDLATAHSESV